VSVLYQKTLLHLCTFIEGLADVPVRLEILGTHQDHAQPITLSPSSAPTPVHIQLHDKADL
jgi:hypothetical protein